MEKLNVAVIGLGMGKGHLAGYGRHARANVVAICDMSAERLAASAKEHHLAPEQCYSDYKKLLGEAKALGLQAVSVALPNILHAPVTTAALDAGLHVLCEKPMAMNAAQARAMLAAAKRARRQIMINFSFRFTEQSQALKRYVADGALGDIYFGRTVWHRRRGLPGLGGWFTTKSLSGGGPIIDLGVHRLDLAMWLMGNPRPLTVSGSAFNGIAHQIAKRAGKSYDVEDLGCAMIRFDNGATVLLEASWAGFSEKREDMVTQLLGTKGGIIQRNVGEGYDFEARAYGETGGTIWESRLQETAAPTLSAYAQFVDAILDGKEVPAPGRHGLDVQLILDAIYKSAATGKEIKIAK